jgi:probable phosphomutase (TIGR03848 family)
MTTLFLVRHAVTAHTGHRLSGWMEGIPLSEEGTAQARALAQMLKGVPFKAIYSSPIDRTLETANAIAATRNLRVRRTKALGEVDYGSWTNRPMKALAKTKLWSQIQRWPSNARFPDGETLREVQARALAEVERIVAEHPKDTICCVSHGDVIKLLIAHYMGVHIDLFQRIVVSPASVSVVSVSDHGPFVVTVNSMPLSSWAKEGKR